MTRVTAADHPCVALSFSEKCSVCPLGPRSQCGPWHLAHGAARAASRPQEGRTCSNVVSILVFNSRLRADPENASRSGRPSIRRDDWSWRVAVRVMAFAVNVIIGMWQWIWKHARAELKAARAASKLKHDTILNLAKREGQERACASSPVSLRDHPRPCPRLPRKDWEVPRSPERREAVENGDRH